jgi:signal transduction histidine kinase
LRGISADIELPDIERLCPADIAARVVRDVHSKAGGSIEMEVSRAPAQASFRTKVALYRLLQESLANTVRHAPGKPSRLEIDTVGSMLRVQVSDKGPGFDVNVAARKGRLGLRGMRQRIEVLGGEFELRTAPGAGTHIRVLLPLTAENESYE